MKKILASILFLVYFAVSTGFVVSMHYCMDRFDSAQLGASGNDKCPKCGMHKDGGCCRDVVKVVKLQTDHIVAPATTLLLPMPVAEPLHEMIFLPSFAIDQQPGLSVAHSPPRSGQDIYLQNRVFRI
jgi:hypothetical protein